MYAAIPPIEITNLATRICYASGLGPEQDPSERNESIVGCGSLFIHRPKTQKKAHDLVSIFADNDTTSGTAAALDVDHAVELDPQEHFDEDILQPFRVVLN